jgi:hypothetical protein
MFIIQLIIKLVLIIINNIFTILGYDIEYYENIINNFLVNIKS